MHTRRHTLRTASAFKAPQSQRGQRACTHSCMSSAERSQRDFTTIQLPLLHWLALCNRGMKKNRHEVFSRIRLGCVHKHRWWRTQHSACPDQTWVSMFRTCLSPQSRFSVNGAQEVDEPPMNLNQLRSEAGSFIKGSSAWMFKAPSCERGLEIKAQSTFPCSLCVFCGRSSASDLWHSGWLVIVS